MVDLVATEPASYLRLWRFLADVDLVQQVRWNRAPLADPLEPGRSSSPGARVVKVMDHLWVRVLDVPRALEARPWGADGPGAGGERRARSRRRPLANVTKDGQAQVTATDDPAQAALAADTLGSVHLGVRRRGHPRGGRADPGEPTALTRFAAMADAGPAPYSITGF